VSRTSGRCIVQLTTIRLKNYRVFSELELEIPPGLVGIYGPNGAGKSSLLESITWALYGKARTAKGEIRTSGSSGECSVELGFVHDDDHYLVRRSISGVNATVKARVELGGSVAADGPAEVAKFLRSTIGMDEAAFRSSVFAEQKQLAAFSENSPDQRRKLILQLLGITPLERARDAARSDFNNQRGTFERLIAMLPALEELEFRAQDAERIVVSARGEDEAAQTRANEARLALDAVREAAKAADHAKAQHELITTKGKAARAKRDQAQAQLDRLIADERVLTEAADALEDLGSARSSEAISSDQQRLAQLGQYQSFERELAEMRIPEVVDEIPSEALRQLRATLDEASERATEAKSLAREAERFVVEAEASLARTSELHGDACPMCGQDLLLGVEGIRKHRTEELRAAKKNRDARKREAIESDDRRKAATKALQDLEGLAQQRQDAIDKTRVHVAKRDALIERISGLREALGAIGLAEQLELEARLAAEQQTDKLRASLLAKLQRSDAIAQDITRQQQTIAEAESERGQLRVELNALAFDVTDYESRQREVSVLRIKEEADRSTAAATARSRAGAEQEAVSAATRLATGREQHASTGELAETIRYVGRAADLLDGFRKAVVASVGPRLSAEASALFNELTANEYDGLEVEPDTYAISIIDGGVKYPSERFSGSEVDLANLALRVAISEQVRFQAGGQVGLLVLDEALASLDVDRKDRMLGALTQLSARFRQILVVTHAPEVKERLPTAIEIKKSVGRRASAQIVEIGAG
jgi:DNA repair protein SbcC/Rad50